MTVEVHLDAPRPVVAVAGVLDRSGAALLTAVLEYVAEQDGRKPVVDLRAVCSADGCGLAAVVERDLELGGSSAAVDRALDRLTGSPADGRSSLPDPGNLSRPTRPRAPLARR